MKKRVLLSGALLISLFSLQGCLKNNDGLGATSEEQANDRKVALMRWKANIDQDYKNCVFVPGKEAACKKEFEEAMVPYQKELAKSK